MANHYFEGKVIWLTGASSGIGEALCQQLAIAGATLVLSARRAEALQKVCQACANPHRHLVLPLDMLTPDSFGAASQQVVERLGRVDILINCAGISHRSKIEATEMSVVRHLMELNYFGPVALSKQVLPAMLARGTGHVVVISSVMGKLSMPARGAYAASKHALHGLFDALRAEVESRGVAVTVICPGYIRTNASFNALEGDGKPHNQLDQEISRGMAPEKCARRILRAIARRRSEVIVARHETLGVWLNRFAPRLFRLLVRRRARRSQ